MKGCDVSNILVSFREFVFLDEKRGTEGLSVPELERWTDLQNRLSEQLDKGKPGGAQERRRHPRVMTHLKCTYERDGNLADATVTDLSPGGAFIATRHPLPMGSVFFFHLTLHSDEPPFKIETRVVSHQGQNQDASGRQALGRQGMGVRFEKLCPRASKCFEELFEAVAASRQKPTGRPEPRRL